MHKFPIFILCCFIFSACINNNSDTKFYSFKNSEWYKDSVCRFEIMITDTLTPHKICLEIRNNNKYPYQNIWLFSDIETPAGKVRQDTLNCELADEFGKWYGQGISVYELEINYEQAFIFPQSGIYTFSIRQGMRDDVLKGITEIGIKVTH